ncbi:MAG: class II aldolase/adducin family protein, partial [Rhodocyclales bacterium]|nr:class II aldolase/adducin family protein [Rhodocyclales bacterium]
MSNDATLRDALLATARALVTARLNIGTSGNASVRTPDGMLITPSGCDPARARAADMV